MIVYRPRPPLDVVVERFWWNLRAEPSTVYEHHLPLGNAQFVVALHDEPLSWAADRSDVLHRWTAGIVHGPQSSYYVSGPKPRGFVVGVSFRPGAAGAVLGFPAGELTDRHVPLEELWGARGRWLHERLAATATPDAAFAVLEDTLAARLRSPLLMHPAVACALHASAADVPQQRVTQIQWETGYSAKHFIAIFRDTVGLTPKRYLRIQRFGSAVRQLAAGWTGTLAELAAAAGYADQSHLTREFREFAGVAPTAYRPAAATSAHHHVAGDLALRGSTR